MPNTITKFDGWNALVHLPASYATSGTKTYPTIVFFPGAGEIGTDINKLRAHGPNAYIDKGWDGSVTVDGKKVEFIVVSIQPTKDYPRPVEVKVKLDVMFSQYRVNKDFVFAAGLSRGGWVINSYVTFRPKVGDISYQKTFKAIFNVQGQMPDDNFGIQSGGGALPYPNEFKNYALNGGKEIAFIQSGDSIGASGVSIVNAMNSAVPGSGIATTTKYGTPAVHGYWEKYFGNKNTEPDKFNLGGITQNGYEWLGRIASATAAVPNVPPTVSAGSDQIVQLPSDSFSLTALANDSDGAIASYKWNVVSGSALLTDFDKATVKVKVFGPGSVELSVEVVDNAGAKASDDVVLTIKEETITEIIDVSGVITLDAKIHMGKSLNVVGDVKITAGRGFPQRYSIEIINEPGKTVTYDGNILSIDNKLTSATPKSLTALMYLGAGKWILAGKL